MTSTVPTPRPISTICTTTDKSRAKRNPEKWGDDSGLNVVFYDPYQQVTSTGAQCLILLILSLTDRVTGRFRKNLHQLR